jgi:hypothetical protein
MIFPRSALVLKRLILTIGYALLLSGPPQIIPDALAAPGGPGGMGPVCPPACPPSPTNCDASLVITATQALQFGQISAPTAGTVTVDTTGVRTSTGGVILINGGTVSPATFSMTTAPYNCAGRNLVIVTVASPAALTGPGPAMTLDTFITTPIAGDAFDPAIPLTVGGTLHVGGLQTPGAYNGTIQVTVTFQ